MKASGGCESLAQLIRITLHPANLGQLLENTTLLLVGKEVLELTLFVAETLGARRHARWRHGEHNVGARHPVDMGPYRVKSMRGDILEAQVLLDCFMQQLNVIVTSHKIRMVRPSRVCILQRTRPPRP